MINIVGIIALVEYTALTIVSALVSYLFYVSNRYKPNFMIKATIYLLSSLTLSLIGITVMRFATVFNMLYIHDYKDIILMTPRFLLLLALINFLKNSIRIKK